MGPVDKFFGLSGHGTDIRTEFSAGLTTFLTMSYIIFVQPAVLGAAGMDKGAVFTATCLASALACVIMGLYANYPIAQAPLMGENFFFAYTVVLSMGYSWEKALALVFISGLAFLALTLSKLREKLADAVPENIKYAIAAGIGLFVALIGFKEAGLIIACPATLVKLGRITSAPVLVAMAGLTTMAALSAKNVKGAILTGIFVSAILAYASGLGKYAGFVSVPPSLAPTFFKLDLRGLMTPDALAVVLIFLFMSLFDTLGTLLGVGVQAGLMRNGRLERVSKALLSDAIATTAGAIMGTSTVSSYIESSTGVAQGGRTGLTAVTVGVFFLLCLFFSPLVASVNSAVQLADGSIIHPVTAPALILVGALMMNAVRRIDWDDLSAAIPAFITLVLIPFTFNIADGIAFGFMAYVLIKTLSGRVRDIPPLLWVISFLLLLRYAFIE
ncbi:MAG: guanine permease [Elusimicrobia bacterium RIFOXYA2_FULL_53_38]|nr:MAG: guanine permease [Elusimicrobia bacterium RIFOXYA2_FULL_53_38]